MRLRLLSRASALAVLQAELVARALSARWPSMDVVLMTRSSEGDRDRGLDLWAAPDKGVFTTDLSQTLIDREADAVVHSWKDLPIASYPGTRVAATLERADPRDVLLVRQDVLVARPATLTVLSSSPRRAWQIETSARDLLPWPIVDLRMSPVRGNIPTRLDKLVSGDGDALVVAKAALDRLLSEDSRAETRRAVRDALDRCRWMVLPLREHPTAPAQGALAVEIAVDRTAVFEWVRAINHEPTWSSVEEERRILQSFGGGCHEAVGATVLTREYGRVTSVRAHVPGRTDTIVWSLDPATPRPPRASADLIWPRPAERDLPRRWALDVPPPPDAEGLWVARADAFPVSWQPHDEQLVWAAGRQTWTRLAARGVWVHGSAEGLGDAEAPAVDALRGRATVWRRLTHSASGDPDALATYEVERDLPDDLASRTHFYWTSGSLFLRALGRYPALDLAWHASGPGRTARVIRDTLGSSGRASVWLDYNQWHHHVTS